ncbi:hypothetical protein [Mesorhizobium sp. SP-1A]|uniref:hypothetical protein n=1 Tax=Mesorhizobium sp. SP-1A TaxID=3077840 RepID=UPI0028F71F79|nr:hypothetical protein [Mesorhizobium sp. SP-1A]
MDDSEIPPSSSRASGSKRRNADGADSQELRALIGIGASAATIDGVEKLLSALTGQIDDCAVVLILQQREALTDENLEKLRKASGADLNVIHDGTTPAPGESISLLWTPRSS